MRFILRPTLGILAGTALGTTATSPHDLRGISLAPPVSASSIGHPGAAEAVAQHQPKQRQPHKPIDERVLAAGKRAHGVRQQHGGTAAMHNTTDAVHAASAHDAPDHVTSAMQQGVKRTPAAAFMTPALGSFKEEAVKEVKMQDNTSADNGVVSEVEDHVASSSGLTEAYFVTMVLVTGSITFIYRGQGVRVVLCILVYLLALSTMKLSVKWVFVVHSFTYPKFITALHLLASMAMGFFILFRRTWLQDAAMVVPTLNEFSCKIVPLAVGFAISLGSNNIALVFCSAAFAEIIASTTPVVAVGMTLAMGLPFNTVLFGPTCLVVAGCVLSVVGEVNFSTTGLALCIVSNIMRAFKATMQQQLMTGATKAKFDPCSLLAWNCLASCIVMFVWSAATEGLEPWEKLATEAEPLRLLFSLAASCINAVILNLSALFVTKDLGAVGAQLVAQTKSVLTVLGGVVVFHETITRQECYGFAAVMLGTYMYSRTEARLKSEQASKAAPA